MNEQITSVLQLKGRTVEIASPATNVSVAVERMNDLHIGALVIIDDGHVVGIFTERDVLARIVAADLDPRSTAIERVMTRNPVTVQPTATVSEALQVMTNRRCRHLPVIEDSRLRGLVSIGDLTSWIVRIQKRTIYDLHDYIRAA
jgi:CBS domain-containing protein